MSLVEAECHATPLAADPPLLAPWIFEQPAPSGLSPCEAGRVRHVIDSAIVQVFGVTHADLSMPSRGKARIALARQSAMYLAHVSCGLSLTDVGQIFGRDRTTVAHACAVVEDRRDDRVFDRALELLEWIVPSLVGQGRLHPDGLS